MSAKQDSGTRPLGSWGSRPDDRKPCILTDRIARMSDSLRQDGNVPDAARVGGKTLHSTPTGIAPDHG